MSPKTILSDLGFDRDGPLASTFRRAAEHERQSADRTKAARPLRALLELAASMASDSVVVDEAKVFQDQLNYVRFLDDLVYLVIRTDALQDRVAVSGDRCCTLTAGQDILCCGDFKANLYLPVSLPPSFRGVDVACAPDGPFWILTSGGQLYRMSDSALQSLGSSEPGQQVTFAEGVRISEFDSQPVELAVNGAAIWIRTSRRGAEVPNTLRRWG